MNPQWPTLFLSFCGIYLMPFLVSGRGRGWKLLNLQSVAGMAFTPMSQVGCFALLDCGSPRVGLSQHRCKN